MIVKLLTEHNSEFLSLKGGRTGLSESTLVKMPHCWKSRVTAQIISGMSNSIYPGQARHYFRLDLHTNCLQRLSADDRRCHCQVKCYRRRCQPFVLVYYMCRFTQLIWAVTWISNNVVCATSKASDQHAHMRSLIRAFASRLNTLWLLSYRPNTIWSF